MSKMKLFLLSLVVIIGVLGGCSSEDTGEESSATNDQTETSGDTVTGNENQEAMVTISITKKKGEETVAKKEIPIEDGAILMDVLKENFKIEEDGGFITSIEGIKANESEKMAWLFFVNDESAKVGANQLELAPGDTVHFDLQSWE